VTDDPRTVLVVMRLENTHQVHPDMIEAACSGCGAKVAVYPSGQRVLREFGSDHVDLVCEVCHGPLKGPVLLAPGFLDDARESVPRRKH
jgi:hypothetical protein